MIVFREGAKKAGWNSCSVVRPDELLIVNQILPAVGTALTACFRDLQSKIFEKPRHINYPWRPDIGRQGGGVLSPR